MTAHENTIRSGCIAALLVLAFTFSAAADDRGAAEEEPRAAAARAAEVRPRVAPSFVDNESADVIFIFDGSGSIDLQEFQFQQDAIAQSLQGFPADGSVAVAVIQFAATAVLEVPLTVLTSPAMVQAVIDEVYDVEKLNGGTRLMPPLVVAHDLFSQFAGGFARTTIVLTDGGVGDAPAAELWSANLRTMSTPVMVCTSLIGWSCPCVECDEDLMMNCANTPEAPTYDPNQISGHYRCTDALAQFDLLCFDCFCLFVFAGGPDCDNDGIPDACEPDCDGDGLPDDCEPDCDDDDIPDDCEADCDGDGVADDCEDPQSLCLGSELHMLTGQAPQDGDRFGEAVSSHGDEVLIGAPRAQGWLWEDTGAAHLFEATPTGWSWVAELNAIDSWPGDRFGAAVSLGGDRALVGAYREDVVGPDSGAAYVFARNAGGPGNWGMQVKLVPGDAAMAAKFGVSVSLSGNVALVGAVGDMHAGLLSGAAYVFERNEGGANNWGQLAKLTASDAAQLAEFGKSVCVRGDLAIVGAPGNVSMGTSGAAYIFKRSAGGIRNWGQIARLGDPDEPTGNHFGTSVSIHGDVALIGSPNFDDCGSRVYIFRYDGADWMLEQRFTAADNAITDRFGEHVSIEGDVAVIGAAGDAHAGPATGAAYVYLFNGTAWQEHAKLTASDAAMDDEFATSVSAHCNTVLVGTPGDNAAAGAVHVVRGVADCNANGILDICDIESGYSFDVNANGVPDECEEVCWAGQVRIAQESSPGAGDFDDNILGCLEPYSTIVSAGDFYTYTTELHSYDGACLQLKKDRSHLLVIEKAGKQMLTIIQDRVFPDDPDGGRAEMSIEVLGDADGAVRRVEDDPEGVDHYAGNPGATIFTSDQVWDECCTDGQILGDLEDEWTAFVQFTEVNGDPTSPPIEGMDAWFAYSADCNQIELALEPGRRVRLQWIPPAPIVPADLNGDGVVDVLDLLLVLGAWGPCPACPEDLNLDGVVDVLDLLLLLGNWT